MIDFNAYIIRGFEFAAWWAGMIFIPVFGVCMFLEITRDEPVVIDRGEY
jgi:hypothetical protein